MIDVLSGPLVSSLACHSYFTKRQIICEVAIFRESGLFCFFLFAYFVSSFAVDLERFGAWPNISSDGFISWLLHVVVACLLNMPL